MSSYVKDPAAVLDYSINWTDWLPDGDTITTSTWTADAGITMDSDSNTTTAATVWVSGGTVGESYNLVNHIVTADGREDDRTIIIRVREQ